MSLNFTPEAFMSSLVGIAITVMLAYSYKQVDKNYDVSLNFNRIAWIILACVFYLEGFSYLFLEPILLIISKLLIFHAATMVLISLTYNMKETVFSPYLLVLHGMGVLFYITAFLPGATDITENADGYRTVIAEGLFNIMDMISVLSLAMVICIFIILKWRNAPYELKHVMRINLVIPLIVIPVCIFGEIIGTAYPVGLLISNASFAFGSGVYIYMLSKTPRLFYILPVKLFRLVIIDNQSNPIYVHDWLKLDVKDPQYKAYFDFMKTFLQNPDEYGGEGTYELELGTCMLYKSNHFTYILYASRASKVLRVSMKNFIKDFERNHEQISIKNIDYNLMYELIQKHLDQYLSRMMTSESQVIHVSKTKRMLTPEVLSKMREIFTDPREFEKVQEELEKTPGCIPESFFDFYQEMKDEIDSEEE